MTVRVIGCEVRFGQIFRRYREFISLYVRMLPLCYRYVIIYAYFTQIMLLKRISVTLFHSYQSNLRLDLCVSFYSRFYAHEFYFGNYNLRGYLQLGLCVALENSIHSDVNVYAVLTVFMQTSQFTNFVTKRG